jgi:hypothetical protein
VSLLPESASFEELVQDCFLAYRGSGLMLSALDVELLTSWAQENVPVEIIARGIRAAAEKAGFDARPDSPALRSLRQCRRWVNLEISRYKRASAGAGDSTAQAPAEARWHQQMVKSLKALARSRVDLEKAIASLLGHSLSQPPTDFDMAGRVEELMWASLHRALPFAQRLQIAKESSVRMGHPPSARGRRLARRFHRMVLLKQLLVWEG